MTPALSPARWSRSNRDDTGDYNMIGYSHDALFGEYLALRRASDLARRTREAAMTLAIFAAGKRGWVTADARLCPVGGP